MGEVKLVYRSFRESFDLYKKVDYKGKIIMPLVVMLLLFIFYLVLGEKFTELILLTVKKQLTTNVFADGFIRIVGKIFTYIIYFYTYKFLVLGILSPFLGLYSEKVEEFYQGNNKKNSFFQNIKYFFRGIGISSVNFGIELIFTFFFFFLGLLLPFKTVFYLITLFIQSFFIAYSFLDYTLERRDFGIKDSLKEAFRNFFSLGFMGLIFMLIISIPIVGVLYGPFYFSGVVTLYYLKKEKVE